MSSNQVRFQREFLQRLASLCNQYEATLRYTTADDGIHIEVDGAEVFAGYLDERPAVQLLEAAAALEPPKPAEPIINTQGAPDANL